MEKLTVLFASPEVVPFAKTGGLADVAGKLPEVISRLGHEIKVFTPKYGTISPLLMDKSQLGPAIKVNVGDNILSAQTYRLLSQETSMETVFIDYPEYFDRAELYIDPDTGRDYIDNDKRFIFLCQAILECARAMNWRPDIIHANDWQTSLLPAYLKTLYADDPLLSKIPAIFTIHNMGYQGIFHEKTYKLLGLPDELFYAVGPFEFWGKVNFMKSAIFYADIISTVSEKYAEEIQSANEYGCGLEGLLHDRRKDLYGIINGVDYDVWSPVRDSIIPFRYNLSNLSGKRKNKVELINRVGLPFRENVLLIGMITRLVDQKGLDIFAPVADKILNLNVQMIVLGTGDEKYEILLKRLEKKYPEKMKAIMAYDNNMAHWIEAGADAFLMPSRYEPCGLNQLYSLKYGTVPIVRATGGLSDTIDDIDEETGLGTGFVFKKYKAQELLLTIGRAVDCFKKKRMWRKIIKQGMQKDFSWFNSANKYIELYHTALEKRKV